MRHGCDLTGRFCEVYGRLAAAVAWLVISGFCVSAAVAGDGEECCPLRAAGEDWVGPLSSGSASTPVQAIRVYRIAIAAQAEYTIFHGGVDGAILAIERALRRVNEIYGRELGLQLELIEGNEQLIYTDPASDPYTLNDSSRKTIDENQANLDRVIGPDNYDLGIVFNTGSRGLAYIRSVCLDGFKGQAVVGADKPEGEAFYLLVAHEIGHQFGANHTFDSPLGDCFAARFGETAYEPGSGTTLMSYAFLDCGPDQVQPMNDAYFHFSSLEAIRTFVTGDVGKLCPRIIATANHLPVVDAGPDRIIPRATPFELTALAEDPDGDEVTYSWEQADLGNGRSLAESETAIGPLFRSSRPAREATRVFPDLEALLAGETLLEERLPEVGRSLSFRVTVRDGHAEAGAYAWDEVEVTVAEDAGPFRVTEPQDGDVWSGDGIVRWEAGGTASGSIGAEWVDVLLSTDGGRSFPHVLAEKTANDGEERVSLPVSEGGQCRVKVQPVGHIFFAISPGDFRIERSPAGELRVWVWRGEEGDLLLRWDGETGAEYLVESRPGLSGLWEVFAGPIPGNGSMVEVPIQVEPLSRQRFFRVVKEQ